MSTPASPLDEVYVALRASLLGQPPDQTIDLAAAAQRPALAPLAGMLAALRITGAYQLTAAALGQTRDAVTLVGTGQYALAGSTLPAVPVAATLTVTAPSGSTQFELALGVTSANWTLASTFPALPLNLAPRAGGRPGLAWTTTSILAEVAVQDATFIAQSGQNSLRLRGLLPPTGPLAAYAGWLSPWPLRLDGELTPGVDATQPPSLELRAIAPGASLDLPPLPSVCDLGIALRAVTGLDPEVAERTSFSELDLVATVRVTDTITVQLMAPLQVSDTNWLLSAQIEHGPPLSGGLAVLAALFGMPVDTLAVPPALSGFDTFRLSDVEVALHRQRGSLVPDEVRTLAITIESPEPWRPPIPGLRLIDVGTRWLLAWTPIEGAVTPVVSGSVYGSLVFGAGDNPPTLDLRATLPYFVLTGSLREDTPIDVAAAFQTLLGRLAPPVPNGMQITELSMIADPSAQTYGAAAAIAVNWPLPFFANLSLTRLRLHAEATQSNVSGGISGRLALPAAAAGADATLDLKAELPPGPDAGWVFSGGLGRGPAPTVGDLINAFVGTAPDAFRALVIERLDGRVDTGDSTWSLAGAIAARFDLTILDTTVRIAAGASVELAVRETGADATGRATASFAVNRLSAELSGDIGIPEPSYALRVRFAQLWLLATVSWRQQHDGVPRHPVVALQLGGTTLGEILEQLVYLAAPTLGFHLDSPWDELLAIDLSRFTLTIDPTESLIELTYAVNADLVLMRLDSIGVRYQLTGENSVELIVSGELLGRPYRGADALRWDIVRDPPPDVPGKGEQLVELRYLALGQRVRLPDPQPLTVAEAITRLVTDMRPKDPKDIDPVAGGPIVFDPASGWLAALDLTVMDTVDVALVFSDPNVYGLSVGLRGERAGSLAGLRFEVLYRRLAGGIGMFRAELQLPEAFRHIELGEVSVTLGVIVVEVYTNGNFRVDLGFPHDRSFERSFAVEVFPFIGRGGIYFGVLNGTTSRRVPAIVGGTFSPVLELGVGLVVGVGKDISIGPLSGGIYVQLEVIFEGVLAWYQSEGGGDSARYHYVQGMAAIHGRLYAEVDFTVVKAALSVEAYAQASVTLEAYRATVFALAVNVSAEAEIEILGFTISFSFSVRYDASFQVGSDSQPPWALAAGQPMQAPLRGSPARMLAVQHAAAEALSARRAPDQTAPRTIRVFDTAPTVAAYLLPVFTVADPPVVWGSNSPAPQAADDPRWRVAFSLFAADGSAAGARTARDVAPESTSADPSPAALLIEALLRRAVASVPGNQPGAVTAGGLAWLAARLADPQWTKDQFNLGALNDFFSANIILDVSGAGAVPPAGAMALPVPPFVQITLTPGGESNLLTDNQTGPLYSWDAGGYLTDFSPATDGPGPTPTDDNRETYQSIAASIFCDWCLMVTRQAVKEASGTLVNRTVPMADGSLDALAADQALLPRDTVSYLVRAGDTVAAVAAYLGTTVAELTALNPALAQQLLTAAPGDQLSVTVGVTGATLAIQNAGLTLAAGAMVTVTNVRVLVRAQDSLASASTRVYGAADPTRLVTDAALADKRVLLAGAQVPVPARSGPLPGLTSLSLVAAITYVRYFADFSPPLTDWYAQSVADLNAAQLSPLPLGQPLPAGLTLTVPAGPMDTGTTSYTTIAGDSLLQIGAALSLAQTPGGYADPRWTAFLAEVTPDNGITVPARPVAVLPGETSDLLATRLVTTLATLTGWLASAPVLDPLSVLTIGSLPFTAGTAYPNLAAIAAAAGLTVAELASRPEVTGAPGLFTAGTPLTLAQLPAQLVATLVAETCGGARLTSISRQVSRSLLQGVRLPSPVTVDNHTRARGPLTALAELSGQQLPAPALDGTTALSGTVEKVDWPEHDLDWLVLNPGTSPGTISYAWTNAELASQYPAASLTVTPASGPSALPVAGEVPRTYGLDHRAELQCAVTLLIPGASTALAGNPTLWPLPASVLAKAAAGDTTPFDLYAAPHTATDVADHATVAGWTFGTHVPVSARRVPGQGNLYELADAEAADRDLLLALARASAGTTVPPTQVVLAIAPVAGAADPAGLAVLAADPQATFLIRTDMATGTRLSAPPVLLTAALSDPAGFLQLLWQGSGAQRGTFLRFATVQGDDLPPGAIAEDGSITLWVVGISRLQQAPAPGGRALRGTDNCALVGPGLDATAHALYLEAHDVGQHPAELVRQAVVPPGSAGITLTIPRPPSPDNPQSPDDPLSPADSAQARLAQRFSLLTSGLTGTYQTARTAPPLPPLREDGSGLPQWARQRAVRAARAAAPASTPLAEPTADPVSLWRYEQVVPVASFGPTSAAPDVAGLPSPASDPYRGFGASGALGVATFGVGFQDVLGNVTSASSGRPVTVSMGYTDPLIGLRSWPATTASWGVARPAADVIVSVTAAFQPAAELPASGGAPGPAADTASRHAARFAQAYLQLVQPTLTGAIVSPLAAQAASPLREGTTPLVRYAAAGYLFATAASELVPAPVTGAATLADVTAAFGTSAESIAPVNSGTALSSLLAAGQPLAVTATASVQLGDSATSIIARVPAGWPKPTPAGLLALPANASGPALTTGAVLTVPEVTFTIGPDAPTLTLAAVASAHQTSPVQLALDNAGRSVVSAGFTVTVLGLAETVGPAGGSFDDLRSAFAADGLEVAISEIAAACAGTAGIFPVNATLQTSHVVASKGSTLAALAGSQLDQVATDNAALRNLYPAGTVLALGVWNPAPTVPDTTETLTQTAMRLGTTPAALLAANPSLTLATAPRLVVPGAVTLPADGVQVPYEIMSGDTLTILAAQFGTDAPTLAQANRLMPGILVPGQTVTVTIGGTGYPTTTTATDTLDSVYQRLHAQNEQIDFAAVVTAIAGTAGLLSVGGLLVCPAASLRPKSGSPPATLSAAAVTAAYGVGPVPFAQANAALVGVLAPGVTLTAPSGQTEVTVASDTLNAVLSRFQAHGVATDIAGLLAASGQVALYRGGAAALLPPAPATVSADAGPATGPFAAPAFPLGCTLRLQRAAAVIDPALKTPNGDGPVERADAVVPAPTDSADGQPRTLDAFIDDCLGALPNLRLAITHADGTALDLWAVDFGPHGISSVTLTAPVSYPGRPGTAPRCLALRPLYPDRQSRTEVLVPLLTASGALDGTTPTSFSDADVEPWARRLVADLDLFLSAPYAAGLYAHAAARDDLRSLLDLRWRLSQALPSGLAPVLIGTDSGNAAAGALAAAGELARLSGTSLGRAYDVTLAVQYDTTAASQYPDPPAPTARLYGAALSAVAPADSPEVTITEAATALGPAASFATFLVTVADPPRQPEIDTSPLSYAVGALEQGIQTLAGTDGAQGGQWLTFVRPLTGGYAVAAVHGDLGAPVLPVPLRLEPSQPLIIAQTAAPASSVVPPPLAAAAQWTFGLTYSHEHAAQDEVLLAVTFNVPGPAQFQARDTTTDLAAALWCYAALADRVRELMGAYAGNATSGGADVRDHIAHSTVELITPIATAWEGHWTAQATELAEPPGAQTYRFRARVDWQPQAEAGVEPALEAVTLSLDGQAQPSPGGNWPAVAWRAADGSFTVLTPDPSGPHDGALRYLPPSPIYRDGPPALRIEWTGLNVATVQNGQASLAVHRNEHLIGEITTNPAFVMRTATITAPEVATPILSVTEPLGLAGTDLGAALTTALGELFGTAGGPPVTVQLAYGHELVGDIRSWWPVGLYPSQPLAPGIATAVASAASAWQASAQPNPAGASWSISLTLSSDLPGRTSRPLLVLDRLLYVVPA
jgi:LysM repeat protein